MTTTDRVAMAINSRAALEAEYSDKRRDLVTVTEDLLDSSLNGAHALATKCQEAYRLYAAREVLYGRPSSPEAIAFFKNVSRLSALITELRATILDVKKGIPE